MGGREGKKGNIQGRGRKHVEMFTNVNTGDL